MTKETAARNETAEAGTVLINGEAHDCSDIGTIRDAVAAIGVDPARSGTAVAVNGEVVRRGEWATTQIQPSDRVEVIQAIAGG